MSGSENPYSIDEFIERMASFEPFESNPKLAVAVSGGGDSMGLALLAFEWTKRCGGSMVAVTVDHGLSCLLYTSPSPRDGLLARMPSSA